MFLPFSCLLGAQEPLSPEAIYKKVLPSVLTLAVEKNDGNKVSGTAFLSLKEGCAVTALHVVENAKRVVAKFSNGEEYDVSGWIDADTKRDVALIRVKVADAPMVSFANGDPEVGAKAFVVGAPQGLEFSISDGLVSQVRQIEGFKQYQFTCPASPGNSGGPLVNAQGEVMGVVSWQMRDGQNLNFAIPGVFVRGLDPSLPTKPWGTGAPLLAASKTSATSLASLTDALTRLHRFAVPLHVETEELVRKNFQRLDSTFLEESLQLGMATGKYVNQPFDEQSRESAQQFFTLLKHAILTSEALEVSSMLRNGGVEGSPLDIAIQKYVVLYRTCEVPAGMKEALDRPENAAFRASIPPRLYTKMFAPPIQKGWKPGELHRESRKRFKDGFTLLSRLALDVDSTGYVFGFLVYPTDPARIYDALGGMPPTQWGFRKDDLVLSVNDEPVASVEELKAKLIAFGKPSKVVVRRKDKEVSLKVDPSRLLKE